MDGGSLSCPFCVPAPARGRPRSRAPTDHVGTSRSWGMRSVSGVKRGGGGWFRTAPPPARTPWGDEPLQVAGASSRATGLPRLHRRDQDLACRDVLAGNPAVHDSLREGGGCLVPG